jgi:molecular chaperone GrpE
MSDMDVNSEEVAEKVQDETEAPIPQELNMSDLIRAKSESLEAEVASLKSALQNETDQRLRAYAELENFRKRKDQEVDSYKKFAAEKFVLGILPAVDSLVLACGHAQSHAASPEKLKEGFELIQKQFEQALEKMGVTKIEAQAVSQEAVEGVAAEMVVREMQAGYRLHDRVIRPSMVVIAS